ncbi:transcriptional regulator [Candidatus Nitrosocosmicus sp. T]
MNGIEKIKGILLLFIAVSVFPAYAYTLFATEYGILLLKLTVAIIVGVIFFIVGWIGITLTVNEKNTDEK